MQRAVSDFVQHASRCRMSIRWTSSAVRLCDGSRSSFRYGEKAGLAADLKQIPVACEHNHSILRLPTLGVMTYKEGDAYYGDGDEKRWLKWRRCAKRLSEALPVVPQSRRPPKPRTLPPRNFSTTNVIITRILTVHTTPI